MIQNLKFVDVNWMKTYVLFFKLFYYDFIFSNKLNLFLRKI